MRNEIVKPHLTNVFKDALRLMWGHKFWWLLGFFAFLISSSISYQILAQGINSVTDPLQWWDRWLLFARGMSPIELFSAQWTILFSDPSGWFRAVFVWVLVLGFSFALLALSIYAIVTLIAAAKLKEINGLESMILALREAKTSFWGVFWAFVLAQIVINAMILVFSLPVISLGLSDSPLHLALLYLFFALFLLGTTVVASLSLFTIMFLVVEEEKLANAVLLSWALFKRHWVITIEMFFFQIVIGVGVVLLLFLITSLITIPITIAGVILVSQQIYDLTVFLPQLTLFILTVITLIGISAYSVFYLYSWTFLFMRFREIHPKSRIATWIEVQLLSR